MSPKMGPETGHPEWVGCRLFLKVLRFWREGGHVRQGVDKSLSLSRSVLFVTFSQFVCRGDYMAYFQGYSAQLQQL